MFGSRKIDWDLFKRQMTKDLKQLKNLKQKKKEAEDAKLESRCQELRDSLTEKSKSAIENRLSDKTKYSIFMGKDEREVVGQNIRCLTYSDRLLLHSEGRWRYSEDLFPCHSILKVAQDAGFAVEYWERSFEAGPELSGDEFVTVVIND
jgi:hypothetical protein